MYVIKQILKNNDYLSIKFTIQTQIKILMDYICLVNV